MNLIAVQSRVTGDLMKNQADYSTHVVCKWSCNQELLPHTECVVLHNEVVQCLRNQELFLHNEVVQLCVVLHTKYTVEPN